MNALASLNYAKPLQVESELSQLVQLLQVEGVTSYLEIGSRYGGSLEIIMSGLPAGSRAMCIDLPGGPFGDNGSKTILLSAAARLRQRGYAIDVMFADSRGKDAMRRAFDAAPFDALMIDGDHAYEAVKSDFLRYGSLARIVILHDIAAPEGVQSRDGRPVEVPRLWRELKEKYRHVEIVAPDTLMGIGIIWRDD